MITNRLMGIIYRKLVTHRTNTVRYTYIYYVGIVWSNVQKLISQRLEI